MNQIIQDGVAIEGKKKDRYYINICPKIMYKNIYYISVTTILFLCYR